MNDWTLTKDKNPTRQGFYKACTLTDEPDAEGVVAEWREYDKKAGKRWWVHLSDDPTIQKQPVPLEGVVRFGKASPDEVTLALKKVLTVEERIEQAYQSYLGVDGLYPSYLENPPEARRINIGDELELGNLKDMKAVALREEGRVVIYSFRDIQSNYGKPLDNGTQYRAEHWIRLIPTHSRRKDLLSRESLLTNGFTSGHLWELVGAVIRGMDSSPDYQRGYVWSDEDQQRYLDTMMQGRDLGRFIVVNRPYPLVDQVLDGKQRLNCVVQFVRSEISWRGVFWHELSRMDRVRLENRVVQVARIAENRHTRADLLRIFLEVNAGGVPQSEEHLAHVRTLLAAEEAQRAEQSTERPI